ncbi:MAG: lipid-binding SYLF domain-containing protein [Acidobacteria bacterium]|nr:lipid-binding SYLF domain-containing protein [Acidobacteriota bacterium]
MRALIRTCIALLVVSPVFALGPKDTKRLHDAETVLTDSVTAPDRGIPQGLLERAECIGVFPGVKKGAFIVGGKFGRGVFTCRTKDGTMGAPAFFSIGGGSFGWQFGGQEADLVLLIMNEDGVKHLLQDHFTIGGELSAAAGPVGRTTDAATDAQLHAEMLSWSRSRGLFLGASLEGAVLNQTKKANESLYGKPVTAKEVLVDQSVGVTAPAKSFVAVATKDSRRSS